MEIISFEVDEGIKEKAEKLFESWGLNISDACNLFLRKAIACGAFPFEVSFQQEIETNSELRKSIIEGIQTPLEECTKLDWEKYFK